MSRVGFLNFVAKDLMSLVKKILYKQYSAVKAKIMQGQVKDERLFVKLCGGFWNVDEKV